jgi:hypothetical protein
MRVPFGSLSPRIQRVAAFVAIVWGLAASFIAFEVLALAGFDLLLGTSQGRAFALSDTVRNAQTCTAPPGAASAPRPAGVTNAEATAWVLGLMSGTHAMVSRWVGVDGSGPDDGSPQWRAFARERATTAGRTAEQLAGELQVPVPATFTGQERGDANTRYMEFVEADTAGTGRAIAAQYSPTACHLYKLGAYWGYAAEVRVALPGERSIFALEIEHHAREAGLPEALWAPVLPATPSNATTAELAAETQRLGVAVTQHLLKTQN